VGLNPDGIAYGADRVAIAQQDRAFVAGDGRTKTVGRLGLFGTGTVD